MIETAKENPRGYKIMEYQMPDIQDIPYCNDAHAYIWGVSDA